RGGLPHPLRARRGRLPPSMAAEAELSAPPVDIRRRPGCLSDKARRAQGQVHADPPSQRDFGALEDGAANRVKRPPVCARRGRAPARLGVRLGAMDVGGAAAGSMTAFRFTVVIPTYQRREVVLSSVRAL